MKFTENVTAKVTEEQAEELKALIEERGGKFNKYHPFTEYAIYIRFSSDENSFHFARQAGSYKEISYKEFKSLVMDEEKKIRTDGVMKHYYTLEEQIRQYPEEAQRILDRIKEEKKPKVGDIGVFWDENKQSVVLSILNNISMFRNREIYECLRELDWDYFEPLTDFSKEGIYKALNYEPNK